MTGKKPICYYGNMKHLNMADEKIHPELLKQNDVVRQSDVAELYLGEKNLREVESLGKFKNLQRLWLNGNKLRKIDCLQSNFRLTEVYLQDNMLLDIVGSLRHLTGLEVLMLQGNQLKRLTDVVHELRKMQRLRVLNLFGNPLAQDYDYRNYVIHSIESLKLLDRQEILKEERDKARKRYGDVTEQIKETLAFGSRVPTTRLADRSVTSPRETAVKYANWGSPDHCLSLDRQHERIFDENSIMKSRQSYREDSVEPQTATPEATTRRSLMQYSTFDWSAMPFSEERRLKPEETEPARIITMCLR